MEGGNRNGIINRELVEKKKCKGR